MPQSPRNTTGPQLLLAEDDASTRLSYAAVLRGAGYRTFEAADGAEALEIAARENLELILLDVDMPRVNGWEALDRLARTNGRPAVIMLTGMTEVDHRVRGLSAGADDYLCKPCDHRELLARVHAVLRRTRTEPGAGKLLHFGPVTVDLANRTATGEKGPVGLTRTEYAILALLAQHPGQLVTRERMLESIWGYTKPSQTRTVDTHVWRLRQKLGDSAGDPRWIQTVPAGGGYKLVSDAVKG